MKRMSQRVLTVAGVLLAVYLWKAKGIEAAGNIVVFALWCNAVILALWGVLGVLIEKPTAPLSPAVRESVGKWATAMHILYAGLMAGAAHFWLAGALIVGLALAHVGIVAQSRTAS